MRIVTIIVLYSLLLAASVWRCFYKLDKIPIFRWDESTNIRVISESDAKQLFPDLVLNHTPFFEKPPLWYWIALPISRMPDFTPSHLRVFSAVCGMTVILVTVYISYRIWGHVAAGITWLTILCTHQLYIPNAGGIFSTHTFRTADSDALLLVLIVISFGLFTVGKMNYQKLILAGLFSGLAVLTKGPSGLIVPIVYTSYVLAGKNHHRQTGIILLWTGITLTGVPWYISMINKFGSPFVMSHIDYHLILRVIKPLEGHDQPWWYYVYIISRFGIFPAFPLFIYSVLYVLKKKMYHSDTPLQLTLISLCIFFLIPTLAQTKLAWYILPFYPFAALLTGAALSHSFRSISAGRV